MPWGRGSAGGREDALVSEQVARLDGIAQGIRRRTLAVACGAHALHDGFTDLLYVLLPLWQAEFGLGYAEIGLLRALYAGAMAGFQLPAGVLAERVGGPLLLAFGTALAGLGYALAGIGGSLAALAAALCLGGLGSSVQHPIGANLVAHAFAGRRSRIALARYNFAGDLGKMTLPAATAGLVVLMPWRRATLLLAGLGLVAAGLVLTFGRGSGESRAPVAGESAEAAAAGSGRGFPLLLAIGIIDSATRMGFLTFLPFLLRLKGAPLPLIGTALTLIFAGGAAGKLVCGSLGARIGVIPAVFLTEALTAAGILLLLPLPLYAALAVLPVIGIALNGTSSVLYGTVPELVPAERRQRAFGLFYTGTIGAGALSPMLYGLFSDAAGVPRMMGLIAGIVLLTLPFAWALRPALGRAPAAG
jgi:FSR family fosmidomycin resistance protein-like MFS transporter